MTLPELKTRRLVLRPLTAGDADAIANLAGRDFRIVRWMTSFSWPYVEGTAERFIAAQDHADPLKSQATYAVTLGGVFIGLMALQAPGDIREEPKCPTLGYWFGWPFQGFGYGTEAARAVIEWGFEAFDCEAIAARVFEDNAASRALLRRIGFEPVAVTQRFSKALDRRVPNVVVRLDREVFEAERAAA